VLETKLSAETKAFYFTRGLLFMIIEPGSKFVEAAIFRDHVQVIYRQ